MSDELRIVTHSDPIRRARSNYIARLAIDAPEGRRLEQVWMHTDDRMVFELCCIPFFPYGISLGDRIAIADDGKFSVVSKSGHQTVRVVLSDVVYAHENHADFHRIVAQTGARSETLGHGSRYWALDVDDAAHAQRLIDALRPLSEARTIDWEWSDPPLDE